MHIPLTSSANAGPDPIRIAICGGGIGGLSLAYMLQKNSNIDVQVYEATSHFEEVGAGLTVWPRTLRILRMVGLKDGYSDLATFPPPEASNLAYDFRKSDQPEEGHVYFERQVPGGLTSFHRAHLLDLFAKKVPTKNCHFKKRLQCYEQTEDHVTLYFADGTQATCDALIGCDGVHSAVRKRVLKEKLLYEEDDSRRKELTECLNPIWSHTNAWRSLIPMSVLKAVAPDHPATKRPQIYCGTRQHAVVYPIAKHTLINFVGCNREPNEEGTYDALYALPPSKEDVDKMYADWEPDLQILLKCITTITRWPIHYLKPLPSWTEGRVTLLGDAAHAMAPHCAAGAGMAIEDSFLLSTLLRHSMVSKVTLPSVLRAYDKVRRGRSEHVMEASEYCGFIYHFVGKNEDELDLLGPEIARHTEWIMSFDPVQDVEVAIGHMMNYIFDDCRSVHKT
ncbi:FAD/NAD-P-binding domain-containing protein [Sistotremastrum niveocremeum HHB9708]|uniref:FAD/NAD-P-binding domain-containing protein n=1 Tax=Sistotremastrum niveocremeum HHB9708 TaxID=1314777 RepID=A0A164QCN9_9AGAM|nr:FAD/NAD-P-binding domain-containing protein [Sistotremastrum niveocremeum HHB9708]